MGRINLLTRPRAQRLENSPPPTPPRLPERYRLWPDSTRALLGRGGAGEVWRAQDQVLGVLVALKVLRAEGARVRSRLSREAALAARVMHPNVVALHDMGTTLDGNPYVGFALASDGSLLDLANNPPAWPELLDLIFDLLHALSALHCRGLLHLDVKMSNLLLHRTGPRRRVLWLADLGIARALHGDTEDDSVVLGTVSYMPAERLTGQRHLWGPTTDLFSTGAIVWRLVTGHLPFPAKDPSAALTSRRRPLPPFLVRPGYVVPPGLEDVLRAMLATDRLERFDLASDATRAFRALPPVVPDGPPPAAVENPAGRPRVQPPQGTPMWFRPAPAAPPRVRPQAHQPRRVPQAPGLLFYRDIPLVGREDELDQLWRAARTAIHYKRPLMVQITGPRGIGRSRLIQEFTRTLEQEGLGEGVTLEYAVRDPAAVGLRGAWRRLAPMGPDLRQHTEQLTALLARDRQLATVEMVREASSVTRWLVPREEDPPVDRSVVRALLAEHLELRSWRGLSWLWLEDLHLAGDDDEVWALLDMVLSRASPVLVLANHREDAPSARMEALVARFGRLIQTLRLRPLNQDESAQLVAAHLPLEPGLTTDLVRHTGGNPRYLRDLLLHWVRLGVLVPGLDRGGGEPAWTLSREAPPLPADRHAFAHDRLEHALRQQPDLLEPLLVVALAGRGTPERVIDRVIGEEGIDRLIVEGLLTLERGSPVLVPPELPTAVRAWPRPAGTDARLHARLADAWAEEGDDPATLASVGRHRADAGLYSDALEPLDHALRALRRTLPPPEAHRLARLMLNVAERADPPEGGRGSPAWARAAMALADAEWLIGRSDGARALDEEIATLPLPPDEAVRAACLHAVHLDREGARVGLARLGKVSNLLARVSSPIQAEYYLTRAVCRNRQLDDEGALEDLGRCLELQPDPATETTARHYRAMLLSLRDRAESFREALRTIEIARQHGFIRWEALAWGAAGEQLVVLGRADEAVSHLRHGVARLAAHGEYRAAGQLVNNMGEVLRRAGRKDEARATYQEVLENAAYQGGDSPAVARANLALMAAVERDAPRILELHRSAGAVGDDPTAGNAWAMLVILARLLQGERVPLPDEGAVDRAVRLGSDGVFLSLAIADLLDASNRGEEGGALRAFTLAAAQRYQVDTVPAEEMLRDFRAAEQKS